MADFDNNEAEVESLEVQKVVETVTLATVKTGDDNRVYASVEQKAEYVGECRP